MQALQRFRGHLSIWRQRKVGLLQLQAPAASTRAQQARCEQADECKRLHARALGVTSYTPHRGILSSTEVSKLATNTTWVSKHSCRTQVYRDMTNDLGVLSTQSSRVARAACEWLELSCNTAHNRRSQEVHWGFESLC